MHERESVRQSHPPPLRVWKRLGVHFWFVVRASSCSSRCSNAAIRACCLMISLRYSTVFMFYLGATQAPFGDGLWASPLQSLWRD